MNSPQGQGAKAQPPPKPGDFKAKENVPGPLEPHPHPAATGIRHYSCTRGEAGQREEGRGHFRKTCAVHAHSRLCPKLSRVNSCASVSPLPPVPTLLCSLPSLLHVGQQLAQQQGWGLHVDAQDLKSEQVEGGDRHRQPSFVFIRHLKSLQFEQQNQMCADLTD